MSPAGFFFRFPAPSFLKHPVPSCEVLYFHLRTLDSPGNYKRMRVKPQHSEAFELQDDHYGDSEIINLLEGGPAWQNGTTGFSPMWLYVKIRSFRTTDRYCGHPRRKRCGCAEGSVSILNREGKSEPVRERVSCSRGYHATCPSLTVANGCAAFALPFLKRCTWRPSGQSILKPIAQSNGDTELYNAYKGLS